MTRIRHERMATGQLPTDVSMSQLFEAIAVRCLP